MKPVPFSHGLTLCDYVIIEERTRNASLINTFSSRRAADTPSVLSPFHCFSVLSDGFGSYDMDLVIIHLESDTEVYSISIVQAFPDPPTTVRLNMRVQECPAPDFGTYEVSLLASGHWIARRLFKLMPRRIDS